MDDVSRVREKIDLVSFISEFITLKKAGRNFRALCPFHNEKSPSFMVSPERQIWHCFGCGKGGDSFTFLMEYENMEFPEALRTLAKKAGIELKESDFRKTQTSEKEKIFEINKLALKYYKYLLLEHKIGKNALEYLTKKRGLNKGIIDTFEIGFAPASASSLSGYLINKKKYKSKDLFLAGISFERGGKAFDFFRGRIIFPLYDHRGNVLGFSGRALNESDMPKYINTRETLVYHKGSVFFGLNLAKEDIKQKQNAILVEGEFDMISLFTQGFKNVVAIKGTALTEDQVALISRFTPKLTFCFDQDSAGFEATKRSLAIIEQRGLPANIIDLKDAKDPDEAIRKNPLEFKKELNNAPNVYDYFIDYYLLNNPKEKAEGKRKITEEILPIISRISNEIIKEHYLKKLAIQLDTSVDSINKEVEKIQTKKEEDKIIVAQNKSRDRRELLEEYVLALALQSEKISEVLEENKEELEKYVFKTPSYQKILDLLSEFYVKNKNETIKQFSNYLPKELLKSFDFLYLYPVPKFATEEKYRAEIKKVSKELLAIYLKERLREVTDKIKNTKKIEDKNSLQKEYAQILSLIRQTRV
ncbi:MAG: DNA primase [Candidatus Levybacteria bacterium RIFCSPLOWO2_01_FULL_36_13]|nr:MAG: DNA primase [Candidatus Levybacteria bacterium RIFCSPHIGHO2_01_FULL_36_15b]OGH34248.1 MAG: DNA primase [Candidatus Levybacteria bacterium RIFCSPLOWO2_01_FULL_36_13]